MKAEKQNQSKLLPRPGEENFKALREGGYYYVDKTQYLKPMFSGTKLCLLMLRPRRFGKSLTLSTLRHFLEMNYEDPGDISAQQKLFKGLKVTEDREFCQNHMGQHPVVMLTLKGVDGLDFRNACDLLGERVWNLTNSFEWLKDSPRLNDGEKKSFNKLLDEDLLCSGTEAGIKTLQTSLSKLCGFLYKHCGRKTVLLIDEYDVPLQKAATGGFYLQMSKVVGAMLGEILKSNDSICKGIVTGCLRATKEGIFTGLNNLTVDTVLTQSDSLCTAIGFTPDEVKAMLGYYGFEDFYEKTKNWYDGYSINGRELFCPWDVSCYVEALCDKQDPSTVKPKAYWNNTSNTNIVTEYMPYLKPHDSDRIEDLISGKNVSIKVDEGMSYGDLKLHNWTSAQFWNILVYTGYLTLVKAGDEDVHEFRIPNAEFLWCFRKNISEYYNTPSTNEYGILAKNFIDQILSANAEYATKSLRSLLAGFVSLRDSATKAPRENFYHGFLNGIFAAAGQNISDYRSQRESGSGYADITFRSVGGTEAVAIELKYASDEKRQLSDLAVSAVAQIDEKGYAKALWNEGTRKVIECGIAFRGRECSITFKEQTMKGKSS